MNWATNSIYMNLLNKECFHFNVVTILWLGNQAMNLTTARLKICSSHSLNMEWQKLIYILAAEKNRERASERTEAEGLNLSMAIKWTKDGSQRKRYGTTLEQRKVPRMMFKWLCFLIKLKMGCNNKWLLDEIELLAVSTPTDNLP